MSFYARQLARRMLKRSTTWTRTDARVWVQEELGHAPADQLLVAVCRSLGRALVTPELEDEVTIMEWVENEVEGLAVDAIDWEAVWEKAHNEGVTTSTLSSFMGNYGKVYERRVEARQKAAARAERLQEEEGVRIELTGEVEDDGTHTVRLGRIVDGPIAPKSRDPRRLPDRDDAAPYGTGFPSMNLHVDGRAFSVEQHPDGDGVHVVLSGKFTTEEAEDLYERWVQERIKFTTAPS